MTRDELKIYAEALRKRVLEHDSIDGKACVVLSARWADEFADAVLKLLEDTHGSQG